MSIRITHETFVDQAAIDALVATAFPTTAEAALVHAMRRRDELATSLVAEEDGVVVGHVAWSPVTLESAAIKASGLAPVAVAASHRRRGVAAALIQAGLEARRAAGDELTVVLGDPAYYGRFGFRAASELGLVDEYGGGDAFQALQLREGAAPPAGRKVRYGAAFADLPADEHGVADGGAAGAAHLAMILALGPAGAFGRGGALPWDLPDDRAHFARTTRGHAVIMGRRTWEETGRALPGRRNLVVSRASQSLPGAEVVTSLDDAIERAHETDPMPFVIGGKRLVEEALPRATRIYLTEVPRALDADVHVDLDRNGLPEVAAWNGRAGERYVVLERSRGR